jgi:hypothetical protein
LGGREGNAGCAGTERKHEEGILKIANLWFEEPIRSESDSKGVAGIFCKSLILRELVVRKSGVATQVFLRNVRRRQKQNDITAWYSGLGFGGAVVLAGAAGKIAAFGDFGVEVFWVVDGFAVRTAACLS